MKAKQQQKVENDAIASWESLETFCNKLDIQVTNNENSLILTEVYNLPPRINFPFKYLKIAPFFVLKNFGKLNAMI